MTHDPTAIVRAALEAAADSLIETSVWCDSQERADASWHNGVVDARKHHMRRILAIDPSTVLSKLEATETARADAAEALAYHRTGVFDKDGREICVGDHIRIDLESKHTKEEYWKPEYEVIFEAPHYTLKHIGGGKNSDTALFYWRVPQPSSTAKIETIALAQQPPASGDDGRG